MTHFCEYPLALGLPWHAEVLHPACQHLPTPITAPTPNTRTPKPYSVQRSPRRPKFEILLVHQPSRPKPLPSCSNPPFAQLGLPERAEALGVFLVHSLSRPIPQSLSPNPPSPCRGYHGKLKFGILPVSTFCSGHTFFTQRMPAKLGLKPFVVHATFQFSGTPGKRFRFREAFLWNVRPPHPLA